MRPVLHGDVSAAARALLAVPATDRERLCGRMIAEAEAADQHVAQTGRLHPVFGNGSLMAAARGRHLADEPGFDNLSYCACFEMVLRHLIRFHANLRRS
ncbi:hypothetical protein [Ruegeria sp. HKCCD7255]|uniref:DUF7742 family protein n=1 Tax=Ruegeria sp. HKCCD7255 TaxID=2683004 RepID=UPI001488AEF3|nr:hypothetical protein [Ruegeria sp. HKCCD7255]